MDAPIGSLTTQGGTKCPVCDRTTSPGAALPDYQLYRCDHCGCWSSDAFVRGAVTSFEAADYFENSDIDRPKWGALFERLGRTGRTIGSLLDIGCGTGAYLAYVASVRPDVRCEGIEIDPGRATEARQRNPGARIHIGDAQESLEATAAPFDLITLWDVFEHVPAPVELLGEVPLLLFILSLLAGEWRLRRLSWLVLRWLRLVLCWLWLVDG
ncbi:MAG: class I SAM-dependent methyltransferase, partial [Myxococcota bacterium]